jgi:hypothetical protein
MMHCDCGKKHRRFPVNLRPSEARYCRKCCTRHSARDNDIWAESRFFGLLWYYYACIDGAIYDITQWAACPKNRLKHMKANSHTVQYRLISTSSMTSMTPSPPLQQTSRSTGRHGVIGGEIDVEDLLAEYLEAGRRRCANTGDCDSVSSASQQTAGLAGGLAAGYRPPERRGDETRPRKAGRRRKMK